MTRIAIIADVHGNLPALEAVQADLLEVAPDQVIVNGDVINRGPQSGECLQAVRVEGWPVVFGNHEEYVLKCAAGELPDEWDTDWWLPTRSVAENLSAEEIAYLGALPWAHVIRVPGLPPVRVVHGSPRALNEGLGFWMSDAEITETIQDVPEPVIVTAHTHRPFDHHVGARWVLNGGAVGVPFNGDPAAQYLVLDGQNGAWQAEFRAVSYDRAPVYAAWERSGQLERSTVAQVFKFELETATFHFMAFVRYCEQHGLELNDQASFVEYRAAAARIKPGHSPAAERFGLHNG
jgi:predicted phosphodiesterase